MEVLRMNVKDLEVYRKAYELAISIYGYAKTMPKDERYELTSQIRRAATNIPINIKVYMDRYEEVSKMLSGMIKAIGKGSLKSVV